LGAPRGGGSGGGEVTAAAEMRVPIRAPSAEVARALETVKSRYAPLP